MKNVEMKSKNFKNADNSDINRNDHYYDFLK